MELRERKPRGGQFDATREQVDYVTNVPAVSKLVAAKTKENPAVLQRSYLIKVIEKMKATKKRTPKKNLHKLILEYKASGEIALQKCACPSFEKVVSNFSPTDMCRSTVHTIYRAIRLAILNHDWSHCLSLFVRILQLRCLTKRHAVHIFRVIVIAALNSNIGGDELEELLRVTFGLANHKFKETFIKSLFLLPKELGEGQRHKMRGRRKMKDENEDESDEEDSE